MISVICVYNDKSILDEFLLKSLNNQTVDYELILIDNRENKFKSAPEALNHGGNKAKGDYLMFVHQDVDLSSDDWLENTEKTLNSLQNLGIAGVAGVSENKKGIISNIEHGVPPKVIGHHVQSPVSVQTLDECLVIIPRSVFENFKFDEKLGGWHFYAVDYSLNIKKSEFDVYVLPEYIYHASHGSVSSDYYSILKLILNKYKKDHEKIHTTIGIWHTKRPLFFQRVIYFFKVWFEIIFH